MTWTIFAIYCGVCYVGMFTLVIIPDKHTNERIPLDFVIIEMLLFSPLIFPVVVFIKITVMCIKLFQYMRKI